ncbi:alpha-aminoadipic semialdehyde synthase, mitochondrial [Folsomia candida]|uniref:alpha-aminoadipic semialdehyde synthase, mitochondrial n=1 Tax=Folsomia candida TaxID=158441 RepID=UPI001604BB16|nr:alpha-aminoadipic semialdehyde synthase, mitochondrial [Folsomia candida]
MKRILILGSGYISGCLVHFLTRVCATTQKYLVTVASVVPKELEDLATQFTNLQTVVINVKEDAEALHDLVGKCDLVVSLLPNDMHLPAAKACIDLRVNMLHASYNSDELIALNDDARQNGVLILGELGLDPGIDHLLAMKCIHEIQEQKGKIVSFVSYCGGLPAPECSGDNYLRYKFSWAPKTALGNLLNGARFLENKSVVEIPRGGGILDETKQLHFLPELGLEGYPNRDSLVYLEKYGLSPHIRTLIRGTLRYTEFSKRVKTLIKVGLLSDDAVDFLDPDVNQAPLTWREFIASLLHINLSTGNNDANSAFRTVLSPTEIETLTSLGLLEDTAVPKVGTPLTALANHLEGMLQFKNGEQDVVILHHELEAKYPMLSSHESVCGRKEFREIDFIVYGDPLQSNRDSNFNQPINRTPTTTPHAYSAMAKTVAYTLGIGAEMMLNGEIKQVGVILPLTRDIYLPILERLAHYGLFAIERILNEFV